jgi:hypothetical protein
MVGQHAGGSSIGGTPIIFAVQPLSCSTRYVRAVSYIFLLLGMCCGPSDLLYLLCFVGYLTLYGCGCFIYKAG